MSNIYSNTSGTIGVVDKEYCMFILYVSNMYNVDECTHTIIQNHSLHLCKLTFLRSLNESNINTRPIQSLSIDGKISP